MDGSTRDDFAREDRAPLYDPSLLERRVAVRYHPLPLDSVDRLRPHLGAVLANAQRERVQDEPRRNARGERDDHDERREGPSKLARTFDRLRLFACPHDDAIAIDPKSNSTMGGCSRQWRLEDLGPRGRNPTASVELRAVPCRNSAWGIIHGICSTTPAVALCVRDPHSRSLQWAS